jgi:hypothetical protein
VIEQHEYAELHEAVEASYDWLERVAAEHHRPNRSKFEPGGWACGLSVRSLWHANRPYALAIIQRFDENEPYVLTLVTS